MLTATRTSTTILSALALLAPIACATAADENGKQDFRQQDSRKQLAFEVVERNARQMTDVSDSIFYFGELGMQEIESTKLLKDTLTAAGFKVDLGGAGMPTNLWAEYGSGHPKIAIVTEVDALPGGSQTPGTYERKPLVQNGPGHMEGHNTHGGVASMAAFAVKQVMDRHNIPGTVAISFGPAEEQIASRPFLVRAGYFKDVDAVIYLHIGDTLTTGYGLQNYAAISSVFTFHGKTAHGAVNPWDGKDAVDAVELMDIGFDKLREHLHPTYRAHRTITIGGVQPNIIPDTGQIWWFVRDASMPAAKETYDKLLKIAEGAALMTGTTWDVKYAASAWPQLVSKAIAEAVQKNIDTVGMPTWTAEEVAFAKDFQKAADKPVVGLRTAPTALGGRPQATSSNDSGDVSWVVPAGSLNFPASVPGIGYHEWKAAVTPVSSISHKGQVAGAKVLAASIIDLLTSPELVQKARAEFEVESKQTPYFSLLPPDAKPDLELNRAEMEKYRSDMRKLYLSKTPRFE
ncbi:MAG: aminobenzoyl-glutamate utilization protein [Alphaproteobacteria bacterium]|jgi:aminobenzoyl-glutamate utilization protein B|nr:aminobenzoyl-glutamate utilization protein [Alphaproteobacteria bacterium]